PITLAAVALQTSGAPQKARLVAAQKSGAQSTLDAARSSPRSQSSAVPTWHRDVGPIIYDKCASCHHPGEVAPFSLLSYNDAKKRAKQIALVTQSKLMPPWKVDASYSDLIEHRGLSSEQISILQRWAQAGALEGNAKTKLQPPQFRSGWKIGTPDAVMQPEAPFTIPAEGADIYRCFILPTGYDADRYLSTMEVRPGNRSVVHHVIAFLDTTGRGRELDAKDPAPGYTSFGGVGFTPSGTLGGWAPGNVPVPLPAGVGMRLPKGADIVLQVHYHPIGKEERDQTQIGLYFSKGPLHKRARMLSIIQPLLDIPPHAPNHEVTVDYTVPENITLLGAMPHMHLLGRDMEVRATLPDGQARPLIKVVDWDFNWQMSYAFRQPVAVPRGTKISVRAHYDNSADNPRNPNNPPKKVTFGEETGDEMCIAFLPYTVDREDLTAGQSVRVLRGEFGGREQQDFEELQRRIDLNKNGKIDDDERVLMNAIIEKYRKEADAKP
ncbi:MAG: hypothetical protein JWN98_988, partial [Abditibacteriota bacterium]|nr:hypothetical protein [Abditibacteriota bacterium]